MDNVQLQFQIWQQCNSLCKFCYLGEDNRITPDQLKISSLQKIIQKIKDLTLYDKFTTLSYLGGEFFQGQLKNPKVKQLFFKVMKISAQLLQKNIIKNVYIYATLTIGDQQDLYETLKLFNKKEGLWILTSYDTFGRFHTKKMEQNWKYHMKHIYQLYPQIKFNITTILSDDCITKYLNNEISFKNMMQEFHSQFFFKQCGSPGNKQEFIKKLPGFFPTRSKFIKFLKKFKKEQSPNMWNKLFNIYYRADILYRNFNNKQNQMVLNIRHKNSNIEVQTSNESDSLTNKCGHLLSYAAYSDCDKCVLCDKEIINNLL